MSELAADRPRRRRRRADARRSIAAILEAAVDVLGERPDASIEDVARAAGVTRQTVYAHFPSREALLDAVLERSLRDAVAQIDAAAIDDGPPAAAMDRLLAAAWQTLERHARLLDVIHAPLEPGELHARHQPIAQRLARLIARGQRSGDFDRTADPAWLVAAALGIVHAAAAEVGAGRMDPRAAEREIRRTVPRALGAGG